MDEQLPAAIPSGLEPEEMGLEKALYGENHEKYAHFLCAVLSCIPWVGSLIGASAVLHAEVQQGKANELVGQWLTEHRRKIIELEITLADIIKRVESFGDEATTRLNDENYLELVRQGFYIWDQANTKTKRDYVRKTLTNAAATRICSDDLVRLFLDWIDKYDDTHFKVIRTLFKNRGATRGLIWEEIGNTEAREDSADADLFKLLILDLSTGHVLRQIRDKNAQGQFLKKSRRGMRSLGSTPIMESAFEDTKPYELTALGAQFATYVLDEAIPRISS